LITLGELVKFFADLNGAYIQVFFPCSDYVMQKPYKNLNSHLKNETIIKFNVLA